MWIQPLCRHEQRAKALPPYGRQTICEAEIAAVLQVLSSPLLTQGPAVPAFERAVAAWVDARHGVAVNSATSALPIACLALGMVLGPGGRLWTHPITLVASANCGRYCGAAVDFVDIDPSAAPMNVAALTAKLEQAEREGTLRHPAEGIGAGAPDGQQLRHGSDWCDS